MDKVLGTLNKQMPSQPSKEYIINFVREIYHDEIFYMAKYNLTNEDVIDSTNIDVFDAVIDDWTRLRKESEGDVDYIDVLSIKHKAMFSIDYQLTVGDKRLFGDRCGLTYVAQEDKFYYRDKIKHLFVIPISIKNDFFEKHGNDEDDFPILRNMNDVETFEKEFNMTFSDEEKKEFEKCFDEFKNSFISWL